MMEPATRPSTPATCTTTRSRPCVVAASIVAVLASVGLAIVLARMLARPLAEIGERGAADRRWRLRRSRPARGTRGARQPRRFVQPDGRLAGAAGGDAPRLHRQRGARAAHAADEPAGLSRGPARRRHHRRPGDLRVAPRGGRSTGPAVALARRARRGRCRDRPARVGRARPGRGDQVGAGPRRAGDRARRPAPRRPTSRHRCRRAPTPIGWPRSWRTCCRTPSATRPPAASSRSRAERRPGDVLVSIAEHGRRASRPRTSIASSSASTGSRSRATAARGGAGIGLAIVKQLVEQGGGRVGAESRDGQTRFWFSLPA